MKNILLMTAALLMFTTSIVSWATSENTNGFVGLWEAVELDGSHLALSITDNGDGTVILLLHDTFWTLCNGGQGIEQGTGEVSAEGSLTADDFPITCLETGKTVKVSATITRNLDDTITWVSSGLFPSIIFHKTSK